MRQCTGPDGPMHGHGATERRAQIEITLRPHMREARGCMHIQYGHAVRTCVRLDLHDRHMASAGCPHALAGAVDKCSVEHNYGNDMDGVATPALP